MQYRREIDGLRAVAVLPVILFHAGFSAFGGGYVGVDVFFVISGYLITLIIVGEKSAGTFSLLRFYERRARRILPALFLVIICCIPFAVAWMIPSQFLDFSRSAAFAIAFISNFFFWKQNGYFAAVAEEQPLLHTWSLAVEEQFYLFYPLFIILMWRFGMKAVVYAVAAFAVAGLVASEVVVRFYPVAAFYLPHTRIWELDIGVLCALWQRSSGQKRSNPLSLLGLALIVFAIFAFDDATPYPSLYALAPTVGTALIILYGSSGTWTARLLSVRPLVGIGLISYSAYLWHQPLFAFARIRSLVEPERWQMALLAVAALALAWLSWRFVERPFRTHGPAPLVSRRAIFASSATVSAVLLLAAGYSDINRGVHPGNADLDRGLQAIYGTPISRFACRNGNMTGAENYLTCDTENVPGGARIAVFGDSHAGAILPAFLRIADDAGLNISSSNLGGCPPILGAYIHRGNDPVGHCYRTTARQIEMAVKEKVDTVFLVARWSLYDGRIGRYMISGSDSDFFTDLDAHQRNYAKMLQSTVDAYRENGIDVFILQQIPQQAFDASEIYRRVILMNAGDSDSGAFIYEHSVSTSDNDALQNDARKIIASLRIGANRLLDLTPAFCDLKKCPMGNAKNSYYRDLDHLSANGVAIAYAALSKLRLPDGIGQMQNAAIPAPSRER